MSIEYKILPSILAADPGRLIEEAQTVDMPEIEYLHVDVMDGHFVSNLTIGPHIVKTLKKQTRFKLDVHLMITNAPDMIPSFIEAGADIITIHQEAVYHLHRQIYRIKEAGVKAGVSLNPATSLDTLNWVINDVDLILIMSVNPGFGGQSYIPQTTEKLAELEKLRNSAKANFSIEVDGGIDANSCARAYQAGARYFVAGSAIFGNSDRKKAIKDIQHTLEQEKRKILGGPI